MGMVMASALSVQKGMLSEREDRRLRELLKKLKLPYEFTDSPQKIWDAVTKDKKRAGDRIHFVLLAGMGNAVVKPIAIEKLREALYA